MSRIANQSKMSKIIEYCKNLNSTLDEVESIVGAIKKEDTPITNGLKDQLDILSKDLNNIGRLIEQKLENNERLKTEQKAA